MLFGTDDCGMYNEDGGKWNYLMGDVTAGEGRLPHLCIYGDAQLSCSVLGRTASHVAVRTCNDL